jgi:hypothetical protein
MEKTQLPEKKKKKNLLIAGLIIFLFLIVLSAALLRLNNPVPSPTLTNVPNPTTTEPISVSYQVDTASLPAPAAEDLTNAVFSPRTDAEDKFLTSNQQKELASTSMLESNTAPVQEQTYTITWKETAISGKIPALPGSVPVYLIARPSDRSVFSVLKDTARALGIRGSVIRTDNQYYAVGNIATGNYSLFFDLYHLSASAKGLSIPSGTGADSIKTILTNAGLLGFPSNVSQNRDQTGAVWYRFTPGLPLPVVSLDRSSGNAFTPGKTGTVDASVDAKGNITEIRKSMPNIVEKGTTPLSSAGEIASRVSSGTFLKGNTELQYPGAASLEDKRAFFTLQNQNNISITGAEVSKIDCGYFVETDPTVQALLAPVCIISGQGIVGGYSVLFRTLVPAVK